MGQWSPPEQIFFNGTASATDATNGYIDIEATSFNQDRVRIWHMGGVCSEAVTKMQHYYYNHDIAGPVPLASETANATFSGFFRGNPYLEVYPCDKVGIRFYNPTETHHYYGNCVIQRWLV